MTASRPNLCVFAPLRESRGLATTAVDPFGRAKDFAGIAIDFACNTKDSAGIFKDSKDFTFRTQSTLTD
jgi:hypothetical protein